MRVKIFSSDPNSFVSYYRSIGPLSKTYHNTFSIIKPNTSVGWSDFVGTDILFMERPDSPQQYQLLHLAHSVGCKVIIDWDINPFAMIDETHPLFKVYTNSETCQIIKQIMIEADRIIVENSNIAYSFRAFNPEIVVRENKPLHIFKLLNHKEKNQSLKKKVLFPSLYFLLSDYEYYKPSLISLIENMGEVEFTFTTPPEHRWIMKELIQYENVIFKDQTYSPWKWFSFLNESRFDLIVSMMRENRFNVCRGKTLDIDGYFGFSNTYTLPDLSQSQLQQEFESELNKVYSCKIPWNYPDPVDYIQKSVEGVR